MRHALRQPSPEITVVKAPSKPAPVLIIGGPAAAAMLGPRRGAVDPFATGAVLADKYFVHRKIGEGGIGVVVAATHLHLEQQVAIKFLNARARQDPALLERFMHEARLSAMVRSNHSVRIQDVARAPDGTPYLVMELLEGEDLGTVVKRGPLPVERAVDYVLQGCEALAEAHSIGIVHRDLKPENMFLARSAGGLPVLKILDFGISKLVSKGTSDVSARVNTNDADSFGTPDYMSPEQLRSSAKVDLRTDIWAIGIVLHELLTGHLPFEGKSLAQLCTGIALRPHEKLSAARPGVPAALEAIVDRCLEKDPAKRYRNVAELAQELAPFGPVTASPRTVHIARIVREGGQSIRPPSLAAGADLGLAASPLFLARPLPPDLTGAPEPSPLPATTTTTLTSTKRWWPWLAAGVAVVAALGALAIQRVPSSDHAVPTKTAQP